MLSEDLSDQAWHTALHYQQHKKEKNTLNSNVGNYKVTDLESSGTKKQTVQTIKEGGRSWQERILFSRPWLSRTLHLASHGLRQRLPTVPFRCPSHCLGCGWTRFITVH